VARSRAGAAVRRARSGADDDFRSVFREIATKHLGATNLNAMFPGFSSPQRLGLLG